MSEHPGLDLMRIEMARQCADALATMDGSRKVDFEIAGHLKDTGRLVLYGVGGSHYVNRMAEPLYREAGIDSFSVSASEALMSPLPSARRVALFVSQSGESGEIVGLLKLPLGEDRRFGLTLNADSTLAHHVERSIVASGGSESAFVATRSIILSIAMHAAVLEALGSSQNGLRAILTANAPTNLSAVMACRGQPRVLPCAARAAGHGRPPGKGRGAGPAPRAPERRACTLPRRLRSPARRAPTRMGDTFLRATQAPAPEAPRCSRRHFIAAAVVLVAVGADDGRCLDGRHPPARN
ncbi:hypothetical protein M8R20_15700 [Pseudomonas sp. R2.Fl]|nr:hypothetical protein [Pseudomonas sp. R2.Fl]